MWHFLTMRDIGMQARTRSRIVRDLSAAILLSSVKIREYKPEDLEQILEGMNGRGSRRREDKFRLLECSDAFFCYVAEDDSEIKGFVIMEDLRDGVSYYMVQINVAERREGAGKQLVRKVLERIGTGGQISLCVNTDNEDAIRFYESLAFRRSGRVEGYSKGQDKYWYEIDL